MADPTTRANVIDDLWRILRTVPDPEIPVISIVDLGIVRDVIAGTNPVVVITPTYSGCPATEMIEQAVREALDTGGFRDARIRTEIHPPWTTDWISEEGRRKLREYGIAPPVEGGSGGRSLFTAAGLSIACPRCGSTETVRVSEFGSTPCKAHYRCQACAEPFDYFKCL
jgi:ring-1,2-phenylacetyl-CoA epoxidase subunit PaaD